MLFVTILVSYAYGRQISSTEVLGTEENICIKRILEHPFTKNSYPGLQDKGVFSEANFNFIQQIFRFCRCKVTYLSDINKEKVQNPIKWSFRDKKLGFEQEDICAVDNFEKKDIQLYYSITVTTIITQLLTAKIEDSLIPGLNRFVDKQFIDQKIDCFQEKILSQCTKINSLRYTYDCVEKFLGSGQKMNKVHNQCPLLNEPAIVTDNDINI